MVFPLEGGCDCGAVRYRIETAPMFVHCCHCRWCQRESGASFALNAISKVIALLHWASNRSSWIRLLAADMDSGLVDARPVELHCGVITLVPVR